MAKYYNTPEAPLTEDVSSGSCDVTCTTNLLQDVIITSGCAGALEFCFTVLGNPGQNILAPIPAYPLDSCVAASRGIEVRFYRLLVRQ